MDDRIHPVNDIREANQPRNRVVEATSVLFFPGVAGILFDFGSTLSRLLEVLQRFLWEPVAWILFIPLAGLCFIYVPIGGTISFNGDDAKTSTSRPLFSHFSER